MNERMEGRKEGRKGGWEGGREGGRKGASPFRRYFYKQELLRSDIVDLLILSGLDVKWSRTSYSRCFLKMQ